MNRPIAISFITCAAIIIGCALTPANVATIEAVDAAACAALTVIPIVGEVAALACPGEEAILAAALAADVAAHPPASALPASSATAAAMPRATVTRRTRHGRKLVGIMRADRATRCQAAIDAHPIVDVPHPEVSMWSIDGGITPSVESLAVEVQRLGVIVESEHGAHADRDGGKDGAP